MKLYITKCKQCGWLCQVRSKLDLEIGTKGSILLPKCNHDVFKIIELLGDIACNNGESYTFTPSDDNF